MARVIDYRRKARAFICKVIDDNPIDVDQPISEDSLHWIMLMGIEHEKIHLETSAVIMQQLPMKYIEPNNKWLFDRAQSCAAANDKCSPDAPEGANYENRMVRVPGGTVKMGKENLEGDFYGWDNESGSEVFSLPDYEVSQKLASNEEYLEFMQDGAYEE